MEQDLLLQEVTGPSEYLERNIKIVTFTNVVRKKKGSLSSMKSLERIKSFSGIISGPVVSPPWNAKLEQYMVAC